MCRQESNLQESLFDLDTEDESEVDRDQMQGDAADPMSPGAVVDGRYGFPEQVQRASNVSVSTHFDGASSHPGSFLNEIPIQQPLAPSMLERVTEGSEILGGGMFISRDPMYSWSQMSDFSAHS